VTLDLLHEEAECFREWVEQVADKLDDPTVLDYIHLGPFPDPREDASPEDAKPLVSSVQLEAVKTAVRRFLDIDQNYNIKTAAPAAYDLAHAFGLVIVNGTVIQDGPGEQDPRLQRRLDELATNQDLGTGDLP
jgi:hypothetical protein